MSGIDKAPPQEQLDTLLKAYLAANVGGYSRDTQQGELEFEVRFGKGVRITRATHDSTISRLLAAGFISGHSESLLRIGTEYLEERSGRQRMSGIRTEVRGLANISTYCRTDSLIDTEGVLGGTKFIRKANYRSGQGYLDPADFWDFGFRVAFQTEQSFASGSGSVQEILNKWKDNKKTFRYITRHRLSHPAMPFVVDVSTVKDSKMAGKQYVPEYTFRESGVLDSIESYEIEIELVNTAVGIGTAYSSPELLGAALRRMIKLVLSGIQQTNYPTSRDERKQIGEEYMTLLWGESDKPKAKGKPVDIHRTRKITSRNFVGPQGMPAQAQNVARVNEDAVIPNVRTDYTVTDKADGDRKLLFINPRGRIYLIDTNMNFQFTGAITRVDALFNTILDGEHILHNKDGDFINLYAAFDLYYLAGEDVRSRPLIAKDETSVGRLQSLVQTINSLSPLSVVKSELSPIRIQAKTFYASSESQSIFQACAVILQKTNDGLFEYETDGIIFTPAGLAVGANKPGETSGKPLRMTWDRSLKWKPAHWNTIDFLVTVQKTANGQDAIGNIFQTGTNVGIATQLTQYKTLILRVGFDEKRHGYINPCKALLDDELPEAGQSSQDDEQGYRPMQFFPTNPPDPGAGLCHVLLRESPSGDKQMFAESNELIENNMIVEFKYDFAKDGQWRWVPLRVRHDKTAEFRAGGKNFGNAFHVANSNWHTIHNPITEGMIGTGEGIPEELADDDVYYNKMSGPSNTRGLRDFHNLFVKKVLIGAASKRGGTLIDLAAGKGGDLPKWISAKLKFVFGIDLSRDNIENRLDGACARYLNYRKKFRVMPKALFVVGNSSVNIRNGDGIISEKGKQVTRAVFGQGAKDVVELGKGVHAHYGVGEKGFDVCSIQFALHYMLSTPEACQNFLRNVSETTKVGGYFIGTCYDGETVFRMLRATPPGESIAIMDGERKLWEVVKRYDREDFPANAASLGYAIDVYQESINKMAREYLVNFEYLTRLLDNYGLVLLEREEANTLGLPSSSGLFAELFGEMQADITRDHRLRDQYGSASKMTEYEKRISFLNRYFIFRKVRDVDAAKVATSMLNQTVEEVEDEEQATKRSEEAARLALSKIPPKRAPKKRGRRLKLQEDPTAES